MAEFRRYPRIPYSGVVFISWKTFDGQRNHAMGRALDVSERGIAIELAARIPVGSFIRVRAYGLNLDGSGTIRRVTRRVGRYALGLELSEPLDSNLLAELAASQNRLMAAVSLSSGPRSEPVHPTALECAPILES